MVALVIAPFSFTNTKSSGPAALLAWKPGRLIPNGGADRENGLRMPAKRSSDTIAAPPHQQAQAFGFIAFFAMEMSIWDKKAGN